MKRMVIAFGLLLVVGTLSLSGLGQTDSPAPAPVEQEGAMMMVGPIPPPATRLEKMVEQRGTLVTRGYTEIGNMQGESGAVVRVSAIEVTDAIKGARELGLVVSVRESSRFDRQAASYVDYDEIDGLVAAIDALAKLDRTATQLDQYEARVQTKGDLEVANVDNNGARIAGVKCAQVLAPSGRVVWGQAFFPVARLSELRRHIQAAKESLDHIKPAAK